MMEPDDATDWKSTDETPDWGDWGQVRVRRADGSIHSDYLEIESSFNGEEEIPIPVLSSGCSFYDFSHWRRIPK